jgi:hypothetical protein
MCVRKLFAPGSSPVNVLRLLNIAKVQWDKAIYTQ